MFEGQSLNEFLDEIKNAYNSESIKVASKQVISMANSNRKTYMIVVDKVKVNKKLEFGDKVYLANPAEHEQYYRGLIGTIINEPDKVNEVVVWFKGVHKAEIRNAEELKLVKVGN